MCGLEQHVRQTQQVRQTISLALLKSTILRTEMWNAGVTREGLRQKTARTEGHLAAVVIVDRIVWPPHPIHRSVQVPNRGPVNVTLFGNTVFRDAIKLT